MSRTLFVQKYMTGIGVPSFPLSTLPSSLRKPLDVHLGRAYLGRKTITAMAVIQWPRSWVPGRMRLWLPPSFYRRLDVPDCPLSSATAAIVIPPLHEEHSGWLSFYRSSTIAEHLALRMALHHVRMSQQPCSILVLYDSHNAYAN